MHYQDQHTVDNHPDVFENDPESVSAPPSAGLDQDLRTDEDVPPPDGIRNTEDARTAEDAPATTDIRPDGADERGEVDEEVGPEAAADRDDRPEFHHPAPVPSAFGATSVGGAVAASALASGDRSAEPDPRDETTVRPGDGAVADAAPDGKPTPTGTVPVEPASTLLARDAAQHLRDQWREVQLRFVDDPRSATEAAQGLVEEGIEALAAALAAQKDQLGDWREDSSHDTEQLRIVIRRYRDLLDRMLDL